MTEPCDKRDSDTPSTDAIAMGFFPGGWMNMSEASAHYNMMLDHARQLERQLAEAKRIASAERPTVEVPGSFEFCNGTVEQSAVSSEAPSACIGSADELDSIAEEELRGSPAAARIVKNVATMLRSIPSHVSPSAALKAKLDEGDAARFRWWLARWAANTDDDLEVLNDTLRDADTPEEIRAAIDRAIASARPATE